MRLEGLSKLKIFNDLIGNRTCDILACSIVPEPTTLPRAPKILHETDDKGKNNYKGEQEDVGRTNCLLSFSTIWTSEKTKTFERGTHRQQDNIA
jgi:hypothetical protein